MFVYIAAPFFSPEQLKKVQLIEETLDRIQIKYFSPRSFGVIKSMSENEKTKTTLEEIYNKNIEMIEKCDTMIALVDDSDKGTLFELGYAAKIKSQKIFRYIISVSFSNKPVNVMLRYCLDAHATNELILVDQLQEIDNFGEVSEENKNFPEVNE